MAFWKPGAERPEAPASLEVDRDGDVAPSVASYNRFEALQLEEQRKRLPIFRHRDAILYLVETHATTILMGETGSGKTTQIPQYLAEAGWAAGGRLIGCTQPRRVAAQTVAARVAEEVGVAVGAEVGYAIRFENVTTEGVTRVKYLTDGVLLREMMDDPLLTRYSVIMVDEAHERGVATDVLLGLLKKVQRRRPDLRIIVASATLDAMELAAFFDRSGERPKALGGEGGAAAPDGKPAIISIEGRAFPVQVQYVEEPVADYLQAAVDTVAAIHRQEPGGDILVFLTGQEEVEAAVELIADEARSAAKGLVALPLYAGLPRADQEAVFGPVPRGKRKVVVATNIAETSLTLEGVVYVVDSGFSKQRFYNPITNLETLVVAPISRASAEQRAGRAGRVRPGKCFRLYTEEAFATELPAAAVPEIQRSSLAPTVLQLKALGVDNIMRFDWLSPPSPEAMVRALELLFALGIIDRAAKLTRPLGTQAAEVPLEPMLAKTLLEASELGCSEEALTVAASLCVQSVWSSHRGRTKEFDETRARFAVAEGDLVTYLNVYEAFLRAKKPASWCHENCLNYRAMLRVRDVRAQLKRLLQGLGRQLSSCGRDTTPIRRAITAGFFPNAAQLQPHGDGSTYKTLHTGQTLNIHPSSILFRATPKVVVFHSVAQADGTFMRDVTAIDASWLTEIAPHFYNQRSRSLP